MKEVVALLLVTVASFARAGLYEKLYGTDYVYAFYADGSDNIEFDEADFKCTWLGYTGLVMIKSQSIANDVAELTDSWGSRSSWIGMNDKFSEGYWYYNDGTKLSDYSFSDWNAGEPNNHRGEDCGCYVALQDVWNDEDCIHSYGFICAAPRTKITALTNSEYVIGDVTSDDQYDGTLAGARQRCTDLGYRLAEVTSDNVLTRIKKNSQWNPSKKYWISGPNRCLNSDSCLGKLSYICEAFHSNDLELSSRQNDYKESETIKVECTASGLPLPNVTWYKDNGIVSLSPGKGTYQNSELGKSTLVIENAKLEDTARYRCFAANLINGESHRTKIYTDIRVHPESMARAGNEASLGGSSARSVDHDSHPADEDVIPRGSECADWTMASWMLPTIFAFNIVILLAIGVLMCNRRSAPTKTAGNEFTNYAVYSTSGKHAGQA